MLGLVRSLTLRKLGDGGEDRDGKKIRSKEVARVLREIQRLFPCVMPSMRLGHTVYDLTGLWLGRAARQPHCISPSAFVVLFGTDQESPNGAQNMEVGWRPKNELETAKCLWSSSQVNPGRGITSPYPSRKVLQCRGLCNACVTRQHFLTRWLYKQSLWLELAEA